MRLVACLLLAGCTVGGGTPGYEPEQPIEYSHALHAGELKIECLHCHFAAETSRHAGVPPANVCMNCHARIESKSPEIAKLKAAFEAGRPIEWVKVHRLPDFAYFNHSRHVNAGVVCQQCHGPVETMVRVSQVPKMNMGWCLDCHRARSVEGHGDVAPPDDCAACHY